MIVHALVGTRGRIVALMGQQRPARSGAAPEYGIAPRSGQTLHAIELAPELEAMPLREIARDYAVELAAGTPSLVRSAR
jgi:hypothetical protein